MSTGADNKTMPGNNAFRDNYDKIFGKDKTPEFGRFVWDDLLHTFVKAEHYQPPPSTALNAPIMAGRFYENLSAKVDDGTGKAVEVDIGSRAKHAEHMRSRGLTVQSDFKETWKKEAEKRAEFMLHGGGAKESARRKDLLGRAFYEHADKKR